MFTEFAWCTSRRQVFPTGYMQDNLDWFACSYGGEAQNTIHSQSMATLMR